MARAIRGWPESAYGPEQVLIKVMNHRVNSMHLEIWQFLPNPEAQHTRPAPTNLPVNTQTIKIDAARVKAPVGASHTIPYADLFDVGHINAADLFSTAQPFQFPQFVFHHSLEE